MYCFFAWSFSSYCASSKLIEEIENG